MHYRSDTSFIAPLEAIQRLTLVVMYYHCNHLRNHLGCTYLVLAISQQPYHPWTSNHFHLHPMMQYHALQKRYQLHCTTGSHTKAYFGCYVLSLQPPQEPPWMYLSSFGHISATIPPMDLKLLSSASSDEVQCITRAIKASLHHGKPYKGLLWLLCTVIATTSGATLDVPIFFWPYLSNHTTYGPQTTFICILQCSTVHYRSDNSFIAPLEAIPRLTLVVMYYHCNHLRNHLGCTYLLLAISQQPYHLWTSNHFHLHPLMQCHALQKR